MNLVIDHQTTRRSILALFSSALLVPVPALAAPADFAASRKFMSGKLDALRRVLRKPKSARRDAELTTIFDTMLDYEFFAKKTLGKHFTRLTPEQVKRFSGTLRKLFQRAYTEKLDNPERYEIAYTGESEGADGTIVQTQMRDLKRRDKPLPMLYVVAKVNGQRLARDVVTDSVSLANNYRKQFGRILKRENGFETLMTKMEKKLAKD